MLIRLKEELDRFHRKQLREHGALYIVADPDYVSMLPYLHDDDSVKRSRGYSAKSIATGETCHLSRGMVEEYKGADDVLI